MSTWRQGSAHTAVPLVSSHRSGHDGRCLLAVMSLRTLAGHVTMQVACCGSTHASQEPEPYSTSLARPTIRPKVARSMQCL